MLRGLVPVVPTPFSAFLDLLPLPFDPLELYLALLPSKLVIFVALFHRDVRNTGIM